MRRAGSQTSSLFTEHYVDLAAADAEVSIAARIRDSGLATFAGVGGRGDVTALTERIMSVTPHRDSDPDGLTTIRDTGRLGALPGFAGLGSGELAPHTDRSGVPDPPRLMLLVCEQPATQGGTSLLTDGGTVFADLHARAPDAALMLSTPRTVFFGTGTGNLSQVFTRHTDSRMSVRLRQDTLARWSPLVTPHIPLLRASIIRNQGAIELEGGQGYLVDNHRWFHARRRFVGARQCLRALGEPRFALTTGFEPCVDPTSAPTAMEAV